MSYTLATEEAEWIGVDHVVCTSTHENGGKSAGTFYFLNWLSNWTLKFSSKTKINNFPFQIINSILT